jgi:ankyrin repeat protein
MSLPPTIWTAAYVDNLDLVKQFIADGVSVNEVSLSGQTPLISALMNQKVSTVEWLLANGADVSQGDTNKLFPIMVPCKINSLELFNMIMVQNPDVNVSDCIGNTPLIAAARHSTKMVRALIRGGADVNALNHQGESPLLICVGTEKGLSSAKTLVKAGANVKVKTEYGRTVLHSAALGAVAKPSLIQYLISHGAEVDASDRTGVSPLMFAAMYLDTDCCEAFRENGADIAKMDMWGRTAMHYAATQGKVDTMAWLYNHGLPYDDEDEAGVTPLFCAAETNQISAVTWLAQALAADIHHRDYMGRTALHWASREGSLDVVSWFLQNGANVNVRDRDGVKPITFATNRDQEAVRSLLESKSGSSCCAIS